MKRRSFNAWDAVKWVVGVFAIAVLISFLIYLALWVPALDRLGNPCKYYPETFIDCER